MSEALPLPPRPNLEQYKKLAKDLQHACQSGEDGPLLEWAARWFDSLARLQLGAIPPARLVARHWRKLQERNENAAKCALAGAQYFIARCHGFESWPRFAQQVEALEKANSPAWLFEQAADAIAVGDLAGLERLLRDDPELVRARSLRAHRSTLLHYVSANGIEDYRQKTPPNIVEIAKFLIDSGAEVNAVSEAYGGASTALNLTATSCHPEAAGVQIPLLELLLARGAWIDGPGEGSTVVSCLHNGRGEAADFLAQRGARLDLEGAAGTGRLDVVRTFFDESGALKPTASEKQRKEGFAWACEFGKTEVAGFLLDHGVAVAERLPHDGQTGLHWAAYGGYPETVGLLLERGAPVNIRDESHNGTALEWSLYAWGNSPYLASPGRYYETVSRLVNAGATLDPQWFEVDDDERRRAVRKLRSDDKMQVALGSVGPAF